MNSIEQISNKLDITKKQLKATINLLKQGCSVPFISRYRKDQTDNLDETQIRNIEKHRNYIQNLNQKRKSIIKKIKEQGNLTKKLRIKLDKAQTLQELKDIYAPYKTKKKTKADKAIENGLKPLAKFIIKEAKNINQVRTKANSFLNQKIDTVSKAIQGAKDIIIQDISDKIKYKKYIRQIVNKYGLLESQLIEKNKDKDTKGIYQDYYNHTESVKSMASHRVLAIDRGESQKILKVSISIKTRFYDKIIDFIKQDFKECKLKRSLYTECIDLAIKNYLYPKIQREIRSNLTNKAKKDAINLFKKNLESLLMQPPIKNKTILGIDPGFASGCKVALIDSKGQYKDNTVFHLVKGKSLKSKAKKKLYQILNKYDVDIIAIGNGTASRETEKFISKCLREFDLDKDIQYLLVNEDGASVYSASKIAQQEYPNLDVTVRGAISIAKRVQDSLAELVKIDPKSLGVGMYQHDLNDSNLDKALSKVIEKVVNNIGVNINTASWALLSYVSGLSDTKAQNILEHRKKNGKFTSRKQLKKVTGIGPKTYQQAAGFIVIYNGKNPLDETIIHPESYDIAKHMLNKVDLDIKDIRKNRDKIKKCLSKINLNKFIENNNYKSQTTKDIYKALIKPRRDPRDSMPQPILKSDILQIDDLREDMKLQGTVRNIVQFGAFIDIGLKNSALLHISNFPTNAYIKDPTKEFFIGEIVEVKIESIDKDRKRVNLYMQN